MQTLLNQAKLATVISGVHTTDLPQVGTAGIGQWQRLSRQGAAAFEHRGSSRCGLDMKHIERFVQDPQPLAFTCVVRVLHKAFGQPVELVGNVLPGVRAFGHDFAIGQLGAERH